MYRRVSAARRICAARGIPAHRAARGADRGGRLGGHDAVACAAGPAHRVRVGSLNQLFGVHGRAPRHAGVGVPREMSVVSFDEDECLAFLEVPVTSVAMPLADWAARRWTP